MEDIFPSKLERLDLWGAVGESRNARVASWRVLLCKNERFTLTDFDIELVDCIVVTTNIGTCQ